MMQKDNPKKGQIGKDNSEKEQSGKGQFPERYLQEKWQFPKGNTWKIIIPKEKI